MLTGSGLLRQKGHDCRLSAGSGCFSEAEDICELCSDCDGLQFTLLFLKGGLAKQLCTEAHRRNASDLAPNLFPDFEERQFLVLKSFSEPDPERLYDFSCHMDHLLTRFISSSGSGSPVAADRSRQMTMQALTYMKNHYQSDIRIEELAALHHYSVSQFRKCFQDQLHCSPKQYLTRLRLCRAAQLLDSTDYSIPQICEECGFGSSNHFIQAFRQAHGMTPLQFRKQIGQFGDGGTILRK